MSASDAATDAAPPSPRLAVLVLAAGYGTRLERDVQADASGRFAHLSGVPKPLVPVGGEPLLTRWLRSFSDAHISLDDVYVVCNAHNHARFVQWAKENKFPESHLVNDGSTSNAGRLGAVRDIDLLLRDTLHFGSEGENASGARKLDGLMVVGGDTLFYPSFSLPSLLSRWRSCPGTSLLLHYPCADPSKHGVLDVDECGVVRRFWEKPLPHQTPSRKACPCFYILSRPALCAVGPFVDQATSLEQVDAPGQLLRHLCELNAGAPSEQQRVRIEAVEIEGRFDIGGLDTYVQCDEWFRQHEASQQTSTQV